MSEIPDDVMKAARRAHAEFANSRCPDNLGTIIARAILAERERCAKVAERREEENMFRAGCAYETDSINAGIWGECATERAAEAAGIASAIRRGDTP